MSKMIKEEQIDWYDRSNKNSHSWGSWFSWGSPVGLSLFFLAVAGAIWIVRQAFKQNSSERLWFRGVFVLRLIIDADR